MDFHGVEATRGAVVGIEQKREFRAAEDYGFDALRLFHLVDDANKFAQR